MKNFVLHFIHIPRLELHMSLRMQVNLDNIQIYQKSYKLSTSWCYFLLWWNVWSYHL